MVGFARRDEGDRITVGRPPRWCIATRVPGEPFRLTAWFGPNHPSLVTGLPPGEKQIDYTGMDITEGGTSIPYWMEDKRLRVEFEKTIGADGGTSRMAPDLYEKPA